MAKLSDKIKLGSAAAKVEAQISPGEDNAESLLNSGVKAVKQRKKKEIEVPKKVPKVPEEVPNSLFEELGVTEKKEPEEQGEKWPKTYEETCEYEIRHAHEMGYPEPDFDFRKIYHKGQHMWFVRVHEKLGEKEMIEVILNTIYPRMIVAVQPKAFCHCIGYNMQEQLFDSKYEAQQYYDSVKVSNRYAEEGEKKRKKKQDNDDDYEDEDDMPSSQESLEALMNGKEIEDDE